MSTQSAITIVDEMAAVLAWLRDEFPEIPSENFGLQEVPEKPDADTFYIRLQNDNREHATSFSIVARREYQIIHFNTLPDVLSRMDTLSRKCIYGNMMIPVDEESKKYVRVDAFSFGSVLDTGDRDDLKAVVGVLSVEVREARSLQAYEKIKYVYSRVKGE